MLTRLKTFAIESKRVFRLTKKPTKQEFWTMAKVSAIGILILGSIGFLIQIGAALIQG